jgi:DNA (cytosine-5)-methyltransferase 1
MEEQSSVTAYYNENDPFAAAWLRELIARGVIEHGEVDERSIRDVTAGDLAGFIHCHFFAGIGVWAYALEQAGWPKTERCWTGSCPCQPFSVSGKRRGASDERHLWPAWFELVKVAQPVRIFGEQVASDDGLAWLDVVSSDLENAGYACGAVDTCAAGFGAPQISQRLFFVAEAGSEESGRLSNFGRAKIPAHDGNGKAVRLATAEKMGRRDRNNSENVGQANRESDTPGNDCTTRQLVQAATERREGKTGNGHDGAGRTQSIACEPGELGAPARGGFGIAGSASGSAGHVAFTDSTGELESANESRREGSEQRSACDARGERPESHGAVSESGGALNGFWRDAEWLWCRDERYRPVEPGTFPLAHGAARRVGRLRGYGNALVAPQAIGFVAAYLAHLEENTTNRKM